MQLFSQNYAFQMCMLFKNVCTSESHKNLCDCGILAKFMFQTVSMKLTMNAKTFLKRSRYDDIRYTFFFLYIIILSKFYMNDKMIKKLRHTFFIKI